MSGHKLTTLRINKLAAAQITQARLMANLRDERKQPHLAALHRQNADEMQVVFAAIERRQMQFENSLDQIQNQTLRTLEREACQSIHSHQTQLYQNVQSLFDALWQETGDALTQETQRMAALHEDILDQNALLNAQQEQLSEIVSASLQQITDAFYQMHARQEEVTENQMLLLEQMQAVIYAQNDDARQMENKNQLVMEKLADAATLLNVIQSTYDHQKFTPGEVQRWCLVLTQAQQNLEQGFPDSAMSSAQTLYQGLAELRLTLQQVQSEWELLHASVLGRLRELQEMAQSMQHIPSFDLDGNDLNQTIEVDFWSGRKLSRLTTAIRALQHRVENEPHTFSSPQWIAILNEQIPSLVKEMEAACHQAVQEALNSQLRINIADIVVQALECQGFVLSSSDYEHEDKRRSYQAAVRNLGGDEILIGVEPGREAAGSNQLRLISADAAQRSEHELQQRAAEILESLRQFGVSAGEIQELPDPVGLEIGGQMPQTRATRSLRNMDQPGMVHS
jgi:hypothetical protein